MLINVLEEHKALRLPSLRGRLRSVHRKLQAKRLWEELCDLWSPKCHGRLHKKSSVTQWQKVWFVRKHLATKATADTQRPASHWPEVATEYIPTLPLAVKSFKHNGRWVWAPSDGGQSSAFPSSHRILHVVVLGECGLLLTGSDVKRRLSE